jgi:hypothetical protein
MARISTYAKDTQVTADDKVIGSSYEGMVNGRPQFVTKNFLISSLMEYFENTIGITADDIQNILNRIGEIEGQFVLTNGNITGLDKSEALYADADRRAELTFTTNTFATETESINGSTMNYFDFAHNLDKYPSIMVTETGSEDQFCMVPVKYIDVNTVRVYFKGKTSGKVYAN